MTDTEFLKTAVDANALVDQLRTSTVEWITFVNNLNDENFNAARTGQWSAGQILMHLNMTEKGIAGVLIGPSEPAPSNRASLHERMQRGLTDTTRKLTAPAFLEPSVQQYNRYRLIEKLKSNRETLEQILKNSADLDNVFTSFPHPYFGLLTGFEWIHNVVLHASRHFAQMQNVTGISNRDSSTL